MLGSEEHPMKTHKNQRVLNPLFPMKTHKNQRVLNPLFPPDSPWRVLNQGTHHGVWGADAFAVTQHGTTLSDVGLQLLEKKYFHGVSSRNQHPYVLKSRYGKVSSLKSTGCGNDLEKHPHE